MEIRITEKFIFAKCFYNSVRWTYLHKARSSGK